MVTKTLTKSVCWRLLSFEILVRIFKVFGVGAWCKWSRRQVTSNRMLWAWTVVVFQRQQNDGVDMHRAAHLSTSCAPFMFQPVACMLVNNRWPVNRPHRQYMACRCQVIFGYWPCLSVLCRTRWLWRMSANRSSNSGRTTSANQEPKETVTMVFYLLSFFSVFFTILFSFHKICYHLLKITSLWWNALHGCTVWALSLKLQKEIAEVTSTALSVD